VVSADTDTTPMDTGAIASRTTYVTGNAIKHGGGKSERHSVRDRRPKCSASTDSTRSARTTRSMVKGFPQRNMHIGDVANHARMVTGQPPIGSASFNPPTVALDPETGQGKPFGTYVYATQIAEVDVDDETGDVDVLRIVASHDCGTPINPMLVEGQVEGGISMGVGFALQEEILFDKNGRQINPNLTNYIMPTSLDMPESKSTSWTTTIRPAHLAPRASASRPSCPRRRPFSTRFTTRSACAFIPCPPRPKKSSPRSKPNGRKRSGKSRPDPGRSRPIPAV
jgi:nicotinate dehydrogenase medium molybdopterin subunit